LVIHFTRPFLATPVCNSGYAYASSLYNKVCRSQLFVNVNNNVLWVRIPAAALPSAPWAICLCH